MNDAWLQSVRMDFWKFAKRCDAGPRLAGVVLHVVPDHYGDRIAVCTADDTVSVWHAGPAHHSTGTNSKGSTNTAPAWHCTARWATPYAARASWAHPAFGAVLATIGRGRTEHDAVVWTDAPAPAPALPAPAPAVTQSARPAASSTTPATASTPFPAPLRAPSARRTQPRMSATSISTTTSSSSSLSSTCYAATAAAATAGTDTAAWECLAALGSSSEGEGGAAAVAFAQQVLPGSPEAVPVLAVAAARAVTVYACAGDPTLRRWAPLCTVAAPTALPAAPRALAWCAVPRHQPHLCAGTAAGDVVVVATRAPAAPPAVVCTLVAAHTAPVTDVAWRPALGRSFDLLATAALDHRVRVWRLTPNHVPGTASGTVSGAPAARSETKQQQQQQWRCVEGSECAVQCVATFELGGATPRALAWNRTGTLLAAACDDDAVRMWQCVGLGDEWRPVPLF